jgi:SH3-like domain-containing protein
MKYLALLSGIARLALLPTLRVDSNSSTLLNPQPVRRWKSCMTSLLVVTIAGFFLISLKVARAQQEVKPPAVPPMLETPRPLDNLETKEPAAPQNTPVSRESIGNGAAAPQNTPVTMKSVGKERANVRAKPKLKAKILFQVFRGYPIKVEKQKDDWVYVTDYKHNAGWVYKPMLSSIKTVVVLAENANIRKGPGLKGPVVKQASGGEIYKLFTEKDRWVKVGYYSKNEVIGWIRDDLVWGE